MNFRTVLFSCVVLAVSLPQLAFAARPFAPAYNNVTQGAFARGANSVMTCDRSRESAARCNAIESTTGPLQFNNNDTFTRWIDVDGVVDLDGVPGDDTYNSSRATISVPTNARVAWAGLYWHGNTRSGPDRTATAPGNSNDVLFQVPGANYANITANWCDTIGDRYACFADVTSRVTQPAGGTYAVANVRANAGEDDYVGGWELLVVYEDDSLPLRSLTVFDGHQQYGSNTTRTFVFEDFLSPLTGPIAAEAGFTIAEGDHGSADSIRFQSEFAPTATTVSTDLGNGSIARFGTSVTTRQPAFRNTLGHDSDVFDVSSLMRNGAREATVTLPAAAGETNELIKVDFAVDVYFPEITTQKTATDLNGGDLVVGDTIRYRIEVANSAGAQDTAVRVSVDDVLTSLLDYVPGSINVVSSVPGGATTGPKTDASGDDVAQWDSAMRTLRVNVGAGATSGQGGALAPGQTVVFTFDAVVLPAAANQRVRNSAVATYEGATLAGSNRIRVASSTSDDPTTNPVDDTVIEPQSDDDGDGLGQNDEDEDNDGILDIDEGFGTDVSLDSDNDGVADVFDSDSPGFVDANLDGTDDRYDIDNDSIPNHLDLDSDGDGVFDIAETSSGALDADDDGRIDVVVDADSDGVADSVDPSEGGSATVPFDTDGVGFDDPWDVDDDEDGILTSVERADAIVFGSDLDGDGIPPWRDLESDGDGIDDAVETVDIDVDGIPDYLDPTQDFLVQPSQGDVLTSGDVTVSGVTEAGAMVMIELLDGVGALVSSQTVTADSNGNFSATFAGNPDGDYQVAATATDSTGASYQQTVGFVIDSVFVAIDQPVDGALTNDSTPGVAGRSTPGTTVTVVFDEGTPDEQTVTTTTNSDGDWFFFAPPLADGAHTVTARVQDGSGGTESDSVQFTVDTTAPVVAIVDPANGSSTADDTPLITGTATPGESVDVLIDGVRVATVTADAAGDWSYQTTASLADGIHVVGARVRDAAGNESSASSQFEVDTVAPALTLTTPQDGATVGSSTPTIAGTAEPGADVVITIDGAVVATVTADASGNWSYVPTTALADGSHTVSVEAFDASGNSTGPISATFTVDTTIPYVQISEPGEGEVISDATPTISGRAEPNLLVQIEIDGVFVGTAASDANGDWSYLVQTPLGEGAHSVTATVNDGTNSSSDTTNFEVDLTAPTLVVTAPLDGETTGANPVLVGTSEPGAFIEVTLPDGTILTTTADANGDWTVTSTALPEGPARLLVTARDAAGNTTSTTVDIVVDITNPIVRITNPDDNTTKSDPLPEYRGTTDEPNAEVILVVDGVEVARTTSDANGNWSYTPTTPLSDGIHRLLAFVEDGAGNRGEDVVDFIVDTRAPGVTIVTPDEGEVVTTDQPVISGRGEPGEVVSITIDGTKVADVTVDQNGDWSYTPTMPLADGEHVVLAESTDMAGNTGSDISTFVVDTVAPFVTIVVPADGAVLGTDTFAVAGRTKPGVLVEIFLDGTKIGEVLANASGEWTFAVTGIAEGSHTVEARVAGATDTSTFTVDLSAPMVTITEPTDGTLTGDSTPTITGTAEPDATVEIFVDGVKVGEATADQDGNWSYTSDELDDGEHTIEARATDPAGNVGTSGTIVITVDTVGPDLTVDTPQDGDTSDGSVTVTGTAEPGSTVEIFVDGEKVGETTAGEDGSWSVDIDDLGEGDREIVVVARDPAGNETEFGPITVTVVIEGGTNNGANNGTNNGTNNGSGPNNGMGPGGDDDPYADSYLQGGCATGASNGPGSALLVLLFGLFVVSSRRRRSKRRD